MQSLEKLFLLTYIQDFLVLELELMLDIGILEGLPILETWMNIC